MAGSGGTAAGGRSGRLARLSACVALLATVALALDLEALQRGATVRTTRSRQPLASASDSDLQLQIMLLQHLQKQQQLLQQQQRQQAHQRPVPNVIDSEEPDTTSRLRSLPPDVLARLLEAQLVKHGAPRQGIPQPGKLHYYHRAQDVPGVAGSSSASRLEARLADDEAPAPAGRHPDSVRSWQQGEPGYRPTGGVRPLLPYDQDDLPLPLRSTGPAYTNSGNEHHRPGLEQEMALYRRIMQAESAPLQAADHRGSMAAGSGASPKSPVRPNTAEKRQPTKEPSVKRAPAVTTGSPQNATTHSPAHIKTSTVGQQPQTSLNASGGGGGGGGGAPGRRLSPAEFKQWLTDEYYRNMAMNFVTMRKRRSVNDALAPIDLSSTGPSDAAAPHPHRALGLIGSGRDQLALRPAGASEPPTKLDILRLLEENLLQEALQLIQMGDKTGSSATGSGPAGRHGKPAAASLAAYDATQRTDRVEVGRDIEKLRRALQKLYVDSESVLRASDAVQQDQQKQQPQLLLPTTAVEAAGPSRGGRPRAEQPLSLPLAANNECPELSLVSSGCSALQGMYPPAAVRDQFLLSCNWHEVCYACGGQLGLSADQCDQTFLADMRAICSQLSGCNRRMVALLIEPLHNKRVFFKRSQPPVCEKTCVINFLLRY